MSSTRRDSKKDIVFKEPEPVKRKSSRIEQIKTQKLDPLYYHPSKLGLFNKSSDNATSQSPRLDEEVVEDKNLNKL